jgi:Macrocin-O-methyltransferase (TylF)
MTYDLREARCQASDVPWRDAHGQTPQLALLRLDGDLYESTMDALKALYEKVSSGGFVIVDDLNDFEPLPPCSFGISRATGH